MVASSSKLLSDGRTLIPKRNRDHLGLRAGDTVCYRVTEFGIRLEKARSKQGDDPLGVFVEWASLEDDLAFAHL